MKSRQAAPLLAATTAVVHPSAFAQAFKTTRPLELVVHIGPGGGSDVLARALAVMAEREKLLPVRILVVNKPGGNSAVAAAYLAEKRGDPNTIGLVHHEYAHGKELFPCAYSW